METLAKLLDINAAVEVVPGVLYFSTVPFHTAIGEPPPYASLGAGGSSRLAADVQRRQAAADLAKGAPSALLSDVVSLPLDELLGDPRTGTSRGTQPLSLSMIVQFSRLLTSLLVDEGHLERDTPWALSKSLFAERGGWSHPDDAHAGAGATASVNAAVSSASAVSSPRSTCGGGSLQQFLTNVSHPSTSTVPAPRRRPIVAWTLTNRHRNLLGATLVGCFCVLVLRWPAASVSHIFCPPFPEYSAVAPVGANNAAAAVAAATRSVDLPRGKGIYPPLDAFSDVWHGQSFLVLRLEDMLQGLEKAILCGFLSSLAEFDVAGFEAAATAGWAWIVPGSVIAFTNPSSGPSHRRGASGREEGTHDAAAAARVSSTVGGRRAVHVAPRCSPGHRGTATAVGTPPRPLPLPRPASPDAVETAPSRSSARGATCSGTGRDSLPCAVDARASGVLTAPAFASLFHSLNVKMVIRLSEEKPRYKPSAFTILGIHYLAFPFREGTQPTDDLVRRFIRATTMALHDHQSAIPNKAEAALHSGKCRSRRKTRTRGKTKSNASGASAAGSVHPPSRGPRGGDEALGAALDLDGRVGVDALSPSSFSSGELKNSYAADSRGKSSPLMSPRAKSASEATRIVLFDSTRPPTAPSHPARAAGGVVTASPPPETRTTVEYASGEMQRVMESSDTALRTYVRMRQHASRFRCRPVPRDPMASSWGGPPASPQHTGDLSNGGVSPGYPSMHGGLESTATPAANNAPVVAVHCCSGLGQTGTLLAFYLMSQYHFTSREAVAWLRLCRPASVEGVQLEYLEQVGDRLALLTEAYNSPGAAVAHGGLAPIPCTPRGVCLPVTPLTLGVAPHRQTHLASLIATRGRVAYASHTTLSERLADTTCHSASDRQHHHHLTARGREWNAPASLPTRAALVKRDFHVFA